MSAPIPSVLSSTFVRSKSQHLVHISDDRCDLTAWDLRFLSDGYIQRGLVFPEPAIPLTDVVGRLEASLARCLDYFYPVSGRLATDKETTVYIDCNNAGVGFTVASCKGISVADLVANDDRDVPEAARWLFPLGDALNHGGHFFPLFAVQVTELSDGIFIACSFNHVAGDGQSFTHFLSSWSELSRGSDHPSRQPILQRVFLHKERIRFIPTDEALSGNNWTRRLRCRVFRFSRKAVARLKAKANEQSEVTGEMMISSLQSLLALIWPAITRARRAPAERISKLWLATGCRKRLDPPLPPEYFGNCVTVPSVNIAAAELLYQDMGSVARTLHGMVRSQGPKASRAFVEGWVMNPFIVTTQKFDAYSIVVGGSPRFQMYENDFGWGKPIGVLGGPAMAVDGNIYALEGKEGSGSIDLQIYLAPSAMEALVLDEELAEILSLE